MDNFLNFGSLNILNSPNMLHQRLEWLCDELNVEDFDVVCLQEVVDDNFAGFNVVEYILENTKLEYGFAGDKTFDPHSKSYFGNAILTKNPIVSSGAVPVDFWGEKQIQPVTVSINIEGVEVNFISHHGAWGGTTDFIRGIELEQISSYANSVKEKNPQSIVILAGDFNAIPESDSIRFLKGLRSGFNSPSAGAYWLDAWSVSGSPENYEFTSSAEIFWAKTTALLKGITNYERLPKRRIDYIFSHDWNYGKRGDVQDFKLWAVNPYGVNGETISDHFGVACKINVAF
jgi:endonuclease/exonuclease/phosphatase family metal-dependent hydrolase